MTTTDVTTDPAADADRHMPNPATFDLNAWLDGVTRTQAVVTLNARQDLGPRIDELVEQLRELNERIRDAGRSERSVVDAGETSVVDVAERDRVKAELARLWEEFESSGVDFELTQMSSTEYDAAIEKVDQRHPEPAFDADDAERAKVRALRESYGSDLIVLGSVTGYGPHGQPRVKARLDDELLKRMQDQFGIRQYAELVGEARALTLVHQEVDAPFSRRVSDALTEDTSGS